MKRLIVIYHAFRQRRRQRQEQRIQQMVNDVIERSHQNSLRESRMLTKLALALSGEREQNVKTPSSLGK